MSSQKEQLEEWHASKDIIEYAIKSLDSKNILQSVEALIDVNLLRHQRLLVATVLGVQCETDKAAALAALVKILNGFIPSIGYMTGRECVLRLVDGIFRKDSTVYYNMIELLSFLIRDEVMSEGVAFALIYFLLGEANDESISIACYIMCSFGKLLQEFDKESEADIAEKLRVIYENPHTNKETYSALSKFFDKRRLLYNGQQWNIDFPFVESNVHNIVVDFSTQTPCIDLDTFKVDEDPEQTNVKYSGIRAEIIEAFFEKKENKSSINDMTDADKTAFKKKIYLILKGSLSGDEAAHKILKLKLKASEKTLVADIVARACSQEATYSKFYGILTERLCSFHDSWRNSFANTFYNDYECMSDNDPSNIRNLGKFWGHALATDCIPFEVFKAVHMNERDSNAANRVFLKFLFHDLVLDMGIDKLKSKFDEPDLQDHLVNLFPNKEYDDIMFSINYFTAIGLGPLTDRMRSTLQKFEEERRERYSNAIRNSELEDKENVRTPRMHPDRLRRNRSRSPIGRRNRSRTPPRRRR